MEVASRTPAIILGSALRSSNQVAITPLMKRSLACSQFEASAAVKAYALGQV